MPSTTKFQQGDIVLVAFPFTATSRAKPRPALVILDVGDADVVVARVTTQPYRTPNDLELIDWQGAGLLAPSVVRLHKLATLDKSLIRRQLGAVRSADRRRIAAVIRRVYGKW